MLQQDFPEKTHTHRIHPTSHGDFIMIWWSSSINLSTNPDMGIQWMFHAWYVHPYTLVIIPIRPHPESEHCSLVCLGRYWIPQNLEGLCTTDQHLLQQKPLPSRNPSKPYNWRFLAGKSSIHCGFSIAMFDNRRLFPECYVCWTSQGKCALQLVFALQCCVSQFQA